MARLFRRYARNRSLAPEPRNRCAHAGRFGGGLAEPARPLFIGRKPRLPSAPLFAAFGDGATALDALRAWPLADTGSDASNLRAIWPQNEGVDDIASTHSYMLTDQRNWRSGLHGVGRLVHEGRIPRENSPAGQDCTAQTQEQ